MAYINSCLSFKSHNSYFILQPYFEVLADDKEQLSQYFRNLIPVTT